MVTTLTRSAVLVAALIIGWIIALTFGLREIDVTPLYGVFITTLLGVGLYASTSGIVIAEFRKQLRTVVVAVTLGVLAKVGMIFGVMYVCYRQPEHIVLAVAVAQIDPLSVAAVRAKSRMSDSAKALLSAWASFDDPITVLLTGYLIVFALGESGSFEASAGAFGVSLALNCAIAGCAFVLWRFVKLRVEKALKPRTGVRILSLALIIALGFGASQFSLLLALALLGLFFRPFFSRDLDMLAEVGMIAAAIAIGLVWEDNFSWAYLGMGIMLGCAAFAAQAVTAFMLTMPKAWRGERIRLALAQQNGMTAITLALLLEPVLTGSIAIVTPAIIIINVLNSAINSWYDRVSAPSLQLASSA
jgi:hypothetical protein